MLEPLCIVSTGEKQDFPKFYIFLKYVSFLFFSSQNWSILLSVPCYPLDNFQCCLSLSYVQRESFAVLGFWESWSTSCCLLYQKPLESTQHCSCLLIIWSCVLVKVEKTKQTYVLRADNDL